MSAEEVGQRRWGRGAGGGEGAEWVGLSGWGRGGGAEWVGQREWELRGSD